MAAGAEGRHTRVRLRQGETTLFVSLFGIPPQQLPYAPGDTVDALVEVSVFNGRSGPMVSAHAKAMRPAGLGNVPATQAAAFAALRAGGTLKREEAAAFLPDRSDTAKNLPHDPRGRPARKRSAAGVRRPSGRKTPAGRSPAWRRCRNWG